MIEAVVLFILGAIVMLFGVQIGFNMGKEVESLNVIQYDKEEK